LRNSTAK
jgi:hypothetical protein